MARMYIIAGCNGAGKTTASYTLIPSMYDITEYVNADEIALTLSPAHPEKASVRASRITLDRINFLIDHNIDFSIETTLSTRSMAKQIANAQARGYIVYLVYFWLNSPELALKRVSLRVHSGGHFIAEETVRRRYAAGLQNLFQIYIPLCDNWTIIDNSKSPSEVVATGNRGEVANIKNIHTYNKIKNYV
ncbi:MAG: zeta toxin family protein [Bacteroidales bacterium]|nr:zeta toxin family protein [Bacteroidales bacterium]